MRSWVRRSGLVGLVGLSTLLASCSLVADFGSYTTRDAAAPMDADTTDSGATCGGLVCESTEACCAETCIPLGTLTDCGGCGDTCDEGLNSDPVCMAGSCDATCDVGFGNCDDNVSNGCEQALNVGEHCGGCGMACDDGDVCATVEGVTSCRSTCPAGEVECGRGCFDLDTSPLHCGDCGMRCRIPIGGGLPMCVAGECADGCADGMADCDDDDTDCEATLVMRFVDADDDDFGVLDTGFMTCPNEPFTADNADDCDDTMMAINPAAMEVCDGADNDCNLMNDDVEGLGETCSCQPGADTGLLVCGSEPAPVCAYPTTESCNGLDDNCDGDSDEGFACVLGSTMTCSLPMIGSCPPTGRRACSTTCDGFGACEPTQLCSRTDGDCDMVVDEGVLTVPAPPRTLSALGGSVSGLRAHVNRDTGQIGLLFASGSDLRFAIIDEAGNFIVSPAPVSPGVTVTERGAGDLTWVGTHWVVGYVAFSGGAQQANIVVLGPDGSVVSTPTSLEREGEEPIAIRLDRMGDSNRAYAAFTTDGGSRFELREAELEVASDGALSILFQNALAGAPNGLRDVDVVSITDGTTDAAVLAVVLVQSAATRVLTGLTSGGSVGSLQELIADGRSQRRLELAFDRRRNQVGMVYAATDGTTDEILLTTFAPGAVAAMTTVLGPVPSRERWHIAAADDGGFGVLTTTGSGPVLGRYDANDLSAWTTHTAATNVDQALVGLPTGDVHYMMFGNTAASAVVQPVQCL